MVKIFLLFNTIDASASMLSGVLALLKPQLFLDVNEVSKSEKFYSRMYAIRAIPIGILFIVLPWVATGIIVSILLF
jgi:hypothetical protein